MSKIYFPNNSIYRFLIVSNSIMYDYHLRCVCVCVCVLVWCAHNWSFSETSWIKSCILPGMGFELIPCDKLSDLEFAFDLAVLTENVHKVERIPLRIEADISHCDTLNICKTPTCWSCSCLRARLMCTKILRPTDRIQWLVAIRDIFIIHGARSSQRR